MSASVSLYGRPSNHSDLASQGYSYPALSPALSVLSPTAFQSQQDQMISESVKTQHTVINSFTDNIPQTALQPNKPASALPKSAAFTPYIVARPMSAANCFVCSEPGVNFLWGKIFCQKHRSQWQMYKQNHSELGTKLKIARERKGVSAERLTDMVNIERRHIDSWEIGTKSPSLDNLIKIATALGEPLSYFFDDAASCTYPKRFQSFSVTDFQPADYVSTEIPELPRDNESNIALSHDENSLFQEGLTAYLEYTMDGLSPFFDQQDDDLFLFGNSAFDSGGDVQGPWDLMESAATQVDPEHVAQTVLQPQEPAFNDKKKIIFESNKTKVIKKHNRAPKNNNFGSINPVWLGKKLSVAREEKNLCEKELASMIGVTETTVIRWEEGASCPKGKLLDKLVRVLEKPYSYFEEIDSTTTSTYYGKLFFD